MRARNVLMVYPRFVADSFFNFRAACEAIGRRSAAAPLGLITVAALLPPEWSVRFLDRNIEELTEHAEAVSPALGTVARGARLSVRVRDRGIDQSRRR
jgi:hypothetical protein